jgi:hypothetical protein
MAGTGHVSYKGLEYISNRLGANAGSLNEPKVGGWGTNPAAVSAAVTDVAPFTEAPEARVSGTSSIVTTTTTNDTYQTVFTITASAARNIGEVFMVPQTTKPTAVDSVQASSGVIGSTSGTTVIVASGANFAANEYIQIRSEVMKITSISTNTLTVTRAQNGTSAISTIAQNDTVTGGNPPGVTAVSNGDLFAHASFTSLALNSGDSLQTTFQVQFTAS